MTSKDTSASERISASYKKLSESAVELNAVSDELGKSISALDNALKSLNLGISAWVKVVGHDDDRSGDFWARHLGYAKIGGRWGIAISDTAGNYNYLPDMQKDEEWLFNDAPRAFRVEAVGLLPDLIEKLISEADETTKKIKEQTAQAKELAATVTELAQAQRRKK